MRAVRVMVIAVGLFLALGPTQVNANPISLSLTTYISYEGTNPTFVDAIIGISGLGNHAAPSLGAFDLDFFFFPDVLSLRSVQFSSYLGDPDMRLVCFDPAGPPVLGAGEAVNGASLIAPDQLNLWGVSLLDTLSLNSLQPDHFVLGALIFNVEQTNTWSRLELHVNALSDEWGTELFPERNVLTCNVSTAPIPEPTTFVLLGGGLALLALRRRRAS